MHTSAGFEVWINTFSCWIWGITGTWGLDMKHICTLYCTWFRKARALQSHTGESALFRTAAYCTPCRFFHTGVAQVSFLWWKLPSDVHSALWCCLGWCASCAVAQKSAPGDTLPSFGLAPRSWGGYHLIQQSVMVQNQGKEKLWERCVAYSTETDTVRKYACVFFFFLSPLACIC